MKDKKLLRKICFSLLGIVILCLGVSLLNIRNVGVDPYSAFNISLGDFFRISLGNFQLTMNILMLIILMIFGRKFLGLGTLFSMVLIGYNVEFFTKTLTATIVYRETLFTKIFS